jgi:hypothetical protein
MQQRGLPAVLPMLASLIVCNPGCREDRKSAIMPPPGPAPVQPSTTPRASLTGSSSPAPATASPATGKLAEAIEKAAAGQARGLHFKYQRGHEMSGIASFSVGDTGAYELSRTARKSVGPLAFTGQLDAAQSQALYGALARASILQVPPSTRPIGDDEQPIALHVDDGQHSFDLSIWANDARDSSQFSELTSTLYPLIENLSQGQIRLRP